MNTEFIGASAPSVFHFHTSSVRVVDRDGEIWFVAGDVCTALQISNPTQAVARLDDDERAMFNIGRQGDANIVSESGLYSLVLSSRKPEAKKFKRWVTHEVLPAIRKTGQYSAPKRPEAAGQFTQAELLAEVLTYGRFFMTVVKGQIRLDPVADDAVLVTNPEDFVKYVSEPTLVPLHALPQIIESAAHRLSGVYGREKG